MGKRKISTKEMMSRSAAIDAVKLFLKGLESGELTVGEGKDSMSLGVPEDMKVSLKGKLKGAKAKVSFSLSWKHEGSVPAVTDSAPPAVAEEAKPPAKKEKAKTPAKMPKAKTPAKKETKKAAPKKKEPAKKAESKAAKKPAKKKSPKKDDAK